MVSYIQLIRTLQRARMWRTYRSPRFLYLDDETREKVSREVFSEKHNYMGGQLTGKELVTMLFGSEVLPGEHLGGIDILFSDRGDL